MFSFSTNFRLVAQKPFLRRLFDAATTQVLDSGLQNFKGAMFKEVDKVLVESLNDVLLPAIRQNLITNKSMFTGTLYSALNFANPESGRVVLEGPDKGSGSRDYARILESGGPRGRRVPRPIGGAEASNIVRWIIFKRNITPEKATAAAGHVIRKIEREGSKPHPYIQPAVDLMMPAVKDLVHQRLADVLGVR